jgi:regulator of replication initiation timing
MTKQEVINKIEDLEKQLNEGIMNSAGSKRSWNKLREVTSDVVLELLDLRDELIKYN